MQHSFFPEVRSDHLDAQAHLVPALRFMHAEIVQNIEVYALLRVMAGMDEVAGGRSKCVSHTDQHQHAASRDNASHTHTGALCVHALWANLLQRLRSMLVRQSRVLHTGSPVETPVGKRHRTHIVSVHHGGIHFVRRHILGFFQVPFSLQYR